MDVKEQAKKQLEKQLQNLVEAIKLPPSVGIDWDGFERDMVDFLDSTPSENTSLENLKKQLEDEIADLEKNALNEIKLKIESKVNEIKELKDTIQKRVEDEINNIEAKITEIENQIEELKNQKKAIEEQIKQKELELQDTDKIKQKIKDDINNKIESSKQELKNKIEDIENEKNKIINNIQSIELKIKESIRNGQETLKQSYIDAKNKLQDTLDKLNKTIITLREDFKNKIENLQKDLRDIPNKVKAKVDEIKKQIESIKQKLIQLFKTITDTEKIKDTLNKTYNNLKEKLKKIKEDIKKKIEQLENLEEVVLKQIEEKIAELKQELIKIKQKIISLMNMDLKFSRTFLIAAERISTAYFKAVSTGQTVFGNKVLFFDKTRFQKALEIGFTLQFLNGVVPMGQLPYYIISFGLISSWATATISPLPPVPPTVTPAPFTPSNIIVFPGSIFPLGTFLKYAFTDFNEIKTPKITAKFLRIAFQLHTSTIAGTYIGLMPSPTGLIPAPPIPWVGIL